MIKRRVGPYNRYTKEFKSQVIKDYLKNPGTDREMSERWNVKVDTISEWIRDYIENPNNKFRIGKDAIPE